MQSLFSFRHLYLRLFSFMISFISRAIKPPSNTHAHINPAGGRPVLKAS